MAMDYLRIFFHLLTDSHLGSTSLNSSLVLSSASACNNWITILYPIKFVCISIHKLSGKWRKLLLNFCEIDIASVDLCRLLKVCFFFMIQISFSRQFWQFLKYNLSILFLQQSCGNKIILMDACNLNNNHLINTSSFALFQTCATFKSLPRARKSPTWVPQQSQGWSLSC